MRRHTYRPDDIHGLRVRLGLFLLLLIALTGTVAYRILEGWPWLDCVYMTAITISTVGFREVSELSHATKIFTIVLILCGVGTMAFTLSGFMEMILRRQIGLLTGRHSMQKDISKLNRHTIVCGYGRMGQLVAQHLAEAGHDLVVIESNPDTAAAAADKGILVVQGNATEEEVLAQAGIEHAASLVAALATDADNLFLTLTARGLHKEIDIIVRANDEDSPRKFRRAGSNHVVMPDIVGADHIVRLLTQPAVVDFVDLVSRDEGIALEVRQILVARDTPFANKTLAEAHIRQVIGGMVLAIRRPGQKTVFDPKPETVLIPGDTLVVVGSRDVAPHTQG